VDEVQFADGFDAPDRLAFGLGAPQLATVVAAAAFGYVLVRSPLPSWFAVPVALLIVGAAAMLGWVSVCGRPAFDWAVLAARFAAGPRRGSWLVATEAVPAAGGASLPAGGPTSILPLFRSHGPQPGERLPQAPDDREPGGARRLTFFSLKGGTGRSTIATELACMLAAGRHGSEQSEPLRVALLDLDLRSASVAVRLGVPHRSILDYALAPPDERRLLDFMLVHRSGAHVLLGPSRPVAAEWPVTTPLLREILRELDMEGFDVVIMDVSPELNQMTCTALTAADDVFVVLTPTAGGVHDAYRTTESLRKMGLRHQLRYVVNRARPDTDLAEPMADLRGQVMAEIPDDESVVAAENQHRLLGLEGSGPAAVALHRLARRVGRELQFPCAS
jgi:MinD-like ATPase involved in chromosome partitioning or flagellar assembly